MSGCYKFNRAKMDEKTKEIEKVEKSLSSLLSLFFIFLWVFMPCSDVLLCYVCIRIITFILSHWFLDFFSNSSHIHSHQEPIERGKSCHFELNSCVIHFFSLGYVAASINSSHWWHWTLISHGLLFLPKIYARPLSNSHSPYDCNLILISF